MIKALIAQAHIRPVVAQLLHAAQVQAGVALCAMEGSHHRVQRGLAGEARHRRAGHIHHIHAGFSGQEQGGHLVAGGVVGMQMDGQPHLLLQGGHQLLGGIGLQQAGHILDSQHMCAPLFQLLGEIYIVL